MKLNLILTAILCIPLTSFNDAVIGLTSKTLTPALSKTQSANYRERCTEIVKNYYDGINVLIGANMIADDQKQNAVESVQEDCFRDNQVRINNTISEIAQDDLSVNKYLSNITLLSDKIEKITYNNDITLSDIYYDGTGNYYYIVASLNQLEISADKTKGNKKVDIYVNFNPKSNLNPKIYSIQNHKEGVLNSQNLAPIVPDNEAEKPIDGIKPYFVFDITPGNADINIDGKNVFFDGNKIETTAGNHTIEINAPNYQGITFGVLASDTGAQHIVRNLPLKHGYLLVNSPDNSVPDPQVYIDSNMVGSMPVDKYQLNVGAHNVEIRGGNNFYKAYHITVTDENTTSLLVEGNSAPKWEEQKDTTDTPAPADVSYQEFYTALSPYGQWVDDPQYGTVWVPDNQNTNFRPYYTGGHWAMSDDGDNTWISDDDVPWGWAAYHYGRWTYNSYYNWVWVPGYQWAPAWVTWRSGETACGWAPLAPGLSVGVSNGCPDSWWVFVGYNNLYNGGYINFWRDPGNNAFYLKNTTFIKGVHTDHNAHVHYFSGPSAAGIERVTHRPVQIYHLSSAGSPRDGNLRGQTINVYRPNLRSSSPYTAHPPSIIQANRLVSRPQEVTGINRQSNFAQDLRTNKLQPRQIYRPSQPIQPDHGVSSTPGQQRLQQQAEQSQRTNQQEQQQQQQQRAQQQGVQSQRTNQQEQQPVQQQRTQQQAQQEQQRNQQIQQQQRMQQQQQQGIQQQQSQQQRQAQRTPQQGTPQNPNITPQQQQAQSPQQPQRARRTQQQPLQQTQQRQVGQPVQQPKPQRQNVNLQPATVRPQRPSKIKY